MPDLVTGSPEARSTRLLAASVVSIAQTIGAVAALHQAHLAMRWQPVPHRLPDTCAGASTSIDLACQELTDSLHALLPPEVRQATSSRRTAYVAGRLCAERALSQLGATGPVLRGPVGEPLWPEGWIGSISHTDRVAFAVAMPSHSGAGIGIDSEEIVDSSGMSDIRSVCCTALERERWFDGTDDEWVATAIFSAKESFYKAIHRHVKRFVDFDEVEVRSLQRVDGRSLARLVLCPSASLNGQVGAVEAWITTRATTVHSVVVL
jgi:enterobactin synthetase component D